MNKYQKTKDYWVYSHTTQDGMYYIGMSQQQPCERWISSKYKETALQPFIELYGWQNITHTVLVDGLTKEQAEQWEDRIITALRMNGLCINKQGSGGYYRDKPKEYWKAWYEANLEQKKACEKQRRSTPQGKIYDRVKGYNRCHPDLAIETPMEARTKYMETGYIPTYIKHDDLFETK